MNRIILVLTLSLLSLPAAASHLDLSFYFSFTDADDGEVVTGVVRGLREGISEPYSVEVLSNTEGFGLGEYYDGSGTHSNTWTVTAGVITSVDFIGFRPYSDFNIHVDLLEDGGNAGLSDDLGVRRVAGEIQFSEVPELSLIISPPSGTYISSQVFDFALIVQGRPELSVVGGTAFLDSTDVSADLGGCLVPGVLLGEGGGQTFRCPRLDGSLVVPGIHLLEVRLYFSDGSSISGNVTWKFEENLEL